MSYTNRVVGIVVLLVIIFEPAACKPQVSGEETAPAPIGKAPETPSVETGSPLEIVVARRGDDEVTMAHVDLAIRRRALLRGVMPEDLVPTERRREPELLYAISRNILEDNALLAAGERLELLPGDDEISAAWREHESLGAVYGMTEPERLLLLAELGLTTNDIFHLVSLELLSERWLDLVLSRITVQQIRDDYYWRNTTVTARIVETPNIATSEEIEIFVAEPPDADWFGAYYRDHLSQFRLPESRDVRVVGLRLPADPTEAEMDALRTEVETMRQEVLAGEDMVAMSVNLSTHPVAERGGVVERAVRRQLPDAFELDAGEVGPVVEGQLGFEFYRVEATHPAEYRSLDHTLEREIASAHLGRLGPLPAPSAIAERARLAMEGGRDAELAAIVQEHRLVMDTIGPFRREPDGMVPGVGTAPALQAELFEMPAERTVTSQYHLVNRRLYVAEIIVRETPTESDFDANRAEIEAEYRRLVRRTAWDAYWGQLEAETPIRFVMPAEYLDVTKED